MVHVSFELNIGPDSRGSLAECKIKRVRSNLVLSLFSLFIILIFVGVPSIRWSRSVCFQKQSSPQ